ncbi:cephamycin biosynthesis protein CmcJ [Colletotrichum paranaense]|uniref:Cephamycin biosynthesis protein CmcJ n=2 Tax=Colletotrichum acutatum species complex TaxID=2707335 RepID=A0AAI9YMJ8_9PEZI|nr:cephamycin biosynthesis protein CmcJ [Colletotrichum costaricense]XP_060355585.1 cephamycin biosynthesis protein CmcJ [Colletotrichum paranaense]XP_060403400.1 cephamycin biosynthesis protein CmcJ [Colletotrichum abscissum]KAK1513745.1 cephamycin biosynthesis protein CmcJ [Colletotrichum abscissum]KAK1515768.1 cephamycin biosynthesis protein CmcJ [Colletotrichum costaricense]KAK1546469.1 cephamycin biosynthesis protein CmcJ [Colletotrichum paranaense]
MIEMGQQGRQVHTKIKYFDDPGVPLVPMIIGGPEPGKPQPKVEIPTTITDITGREDEFTLDVQGFHYVKHQSRLTNWDDDEEIKRVNYPEMEELCYKVLSETENMPKPCLVHIMTHIIRRGPKDGEGPKGPAPLYGMWRPIRPITRDPFAVSDARTIPDSDLVFVPVRFPDHDTEAVEVRPPTASQHKWYFKDQQQVDDVLFFKQVDSSTKPGVPRRVPHCAFKDTDLPEGAGEPRASIEVRAFVFYDED